MAIPSAGSSNYNDIRFPPFPQPPAGVQIIPFDAFKEVGIKLGGTGDIELDGLGIPTIPLRVKHDIDTAKTDPRRTVHQRAADAATEKAMREAAEAAARIDQHTITWFPGWQTSAKMKWRRQKFSGCAL